MAGMMRQLISENRLDYPTVVLREGGTPITVTITKNGPIAALITSARDNVEVEMLTQLGFADADKFLAQSSKVMTRTFNEAEGLFGASGEQQAEVELLRDFQLWLEDGGAYDVIVPFAPQVRAAFGRTPRAVRIRRDTGTSIAAISTSAVLHKAQREVDGHGRIVATLADYEHAWDAFNPGVSIFYNPQCGADIIALVRVLERMAEEERVGAVAKQAAGGGPDIRLKPSYLSGGETPDVTVTATARRLAKELGLASPDTAAVRTSVATSAGVIKRVNEGAPRVRPSQYQVRISSYELAKGGVAPGVPAGG